mgnify:CR=1 FL=1
MKPQVNIDYKNVLSLVKQLPPNKISKLRQELDTLFITKTDKKDVGQLEKLILSCPVMGDKQYQNFLESRKQFVKWRHK